MTLIANGKIWELACELNVVHHCNLACRGCSHQAPQATRYLSSPDRVFQDFSTLARNYHCRYVRLVGGEPLLHPALLDVINAVARSGISDHVRVKTNGTLLSNMPDCFWTTVKEVHVSVYPGFAPSQEEIDAWKRKAAEHHAALKLFYYSTFREIYPNRGTADARLVEQVYATCRPAHLWGCHTVAEGFFFKCPEAWILSRMPQANDSTEHPRDGLRISDAPTFRDELAAYLSSREPLEACQNCLGSAGKPFAHDQAARQFVSALRSTEELIDMQHLLQLRVTRLPRTLFFRAERMLDAGKSRARRLL